MWTQLGIKASWENNVIRRLSGLVKTMALVLTLFIYIFRIIEIYSDIVVAITYIFYSKFPFFPIPLKIPEI